MYSIHPIHPGKSSRFLKNPLKSKIGNNIIGTTADTDFGSNIILPINNPKADPQNDIRANTKQCIKNCPPVFDKSIMK